MSPADPRWLCGACRTLNFGADACRCGVSSPFADSPDSVEMWADDKPTVAALRLAIKAFASANASIADDNIRLLAINEHYYRKAARAALSESPQQLEK